jgi:adenosine deaminase
MELVEELDHKRPKRVVALSIDGNQAVPSAGNARFIPAFKAARQNGLGTTAHAGESSGPEGVRSALDELGVKRIDHGVRAAEDPALLRRLAEEQITLNVCLSSNVALLYHDINRHPLPRLLEASVPVTINTDDPMLLSTTMNREIELASNLCHLGVDGIAAIMHQAATAAFCEPRHSNELHNLIDQWVAGIDGHHEHHGEDSTS